MKNNGRFLFGLAGVALAVTYLVWTGVSQTMVYYMTPVELIERVEADSTFHEVGVKVSGKLVPGSHREAAGRVHHFEVADLEHADVRFPVVYRDVLPDTFHGDDVQVLVEGRMAADGVFQATTVLTKCGSRYEASPEALQTAASPPAPAGDDGGGEGAR